MRIFVKKIVLLHGVIKHPVLYLQQHHVQGFNILYLPSIATKSVTAYLVSRGRCQL
jgi:hypothetical protein